MAYSVYIQCIIYCYFIGSIPCAYLYCKVRGADVRTIGSGNVGATNAARLFGKSAFFTVFILDFLKGLLPLKLLVPALTSETTPELYLVAFTALVCGHIWTIFLKFKGGKGVATSVGALTALFPCEALMVLSVFILLFLMTRIVSIASIIAAICLPFFAFFRGQTTEMVLFCVAIAILIVYTHRQNIKRLIKGEEQKWEKKSKTPSEISG